MIIYKLTAEYIQVKGTSFQSPELRFVLHTDKGSVGVRHLISDIPHEQSVLDYIFETAKKSLLDELKKEKV